MRTLLFISNATNPGRKKKIPHVLCIMHSHLDWMAIFSSLPFRKTGWGVWQTFCKHWSPPQISGLKNKFCIYPWLEQQQNFKTEGSQWVTGPSFPCSSGPLQMKTRWHFKPSTFQLNVNRIGCNLQHHNVLEPKAFPWFLEEAITTKVEFQYSFCESISLLLGTFGEIRRFPWLWFKFIV